MAPRNAYAYALASLAEPPLQEILQQPATQADRLLRFLAKAEHTVPSGYQRQQIAGGLVALTSQEHALQVLDLAKDAQVDISAAVPALRELAGFQAALRAHWQVIQQKHAAQAAVAPRVGDAAQREAAREAKAAEKRAQREAGAAEKRRKAYADRLLHKAKLREARERCERGADALQRELAPDRTGHTQAWWDLFRFLELLELRGYVLGTIPRDVLKELVAMRITPSQAYERVTA